MKSREMSSNYWQGALTGKKDIKETNNVVKEL